MTNPGLKRGLGAAATQPLVPEPLPQVSGKWYSTPVSNAAGVNRVAGTLYAIPFYVPELTNYDGVGVVVTANVVGATIRLGAYTGVPGLPDQLLVEWGSISAAVDPITFRGFNTLERFRRSWIWLACAVQGANAHLYCSGGLAGTGVPVGMSDPTTGQSAGYARTGVTGALPRSWEQGIDPAAAYVDENRVPVVYLRKQ